MARRIVVHLCAYFLLLFWASFAWGQETTGDPAGPFGSITGGTVDDVDLATLSVTVKVPIISKQGPIPTNVYDLFHSGGCYYYTDQTTGAPTVGCFTPGLTPLFPKATPFPTTHIAGLLGAQPMASAINTCGTPPTNGTIYQLLILTTDGSLHPIPGQLNGCTGNTLTGVSYDGSGLSLTAQFAGPSNNGNITFTITASDGELTNGTLNLTRGVTGSQTTIDAFGNAGFFNLGIPNQIVDYLSYPTSTLSNNGSDLSHPGNTWTWLDTNGASQSRVTTDGPNGNFGFPASCNNFQGQPGWNQPTSFTYTYPDTSTEVVSMESISPNFTARIGSVKLRTEATISYSYGPLICTPSGVTELYPSTLTRTTPDGATTYTLSIVSHNGTHLDVTDTVMDPGGNKSVYMFTGYGASYADPLNYAPVVTQVQKYQNIGSPTSPNNVLQSTTIYCYNKVQSNPANCPTQTYAAPFGYPITQKDIYTYLGSGSTYMSHETITYDSTYGNTLTDATTDQITGQTVTKTIVYGTWNGSSCASIGNNINDQPCTITTTSGSTQLAKTTFTYDTNTNTPYAIGMLTSKTEWVSGTDSLTTNYTPNSIRGTYASVQLPNQQTINYTYADSHSGGCNNLLSTGRSITVNGVTLTAGTTWNCNMGVSVDTTDYNGNEDDTTYDAMGRIASYTDRAEYLTTYTYGVTSGNLASVNSHSSMSSPSVVHDHTDYFDGLGRTTVSQTQQKPNSAGYDTVSKTYGWKSGSTALSNFQTTTSIACSQPAGVACSTVALTSLSNPAFGPVKTTDADHGTGTYARNANDTSFTAGPAPTGEHTKVVQTEVDGFGRLKSSCDLETTGGTACGQVMGNSGILTSSSYSFGAGSVTTKTTRGVQTHTEITDSLGRTTSVNTPEAGTTKFSYDIVPSGCFQSGINEKGFWTQTLFQDGNQICPEHDGLGRVLVLLASNGSNQCRRFVYDVSTNGIVSAPTGYSGQNLLGRIVEAETDNCVSPITPITDEWFSYDKDGRTTDEWESTPNSGGYYHTTVGYNAEGSVASLSGIPSTAAFTFGVDGQGRPNAMNQGTTTIISATAGSGFKYDHAGAVLNVPIGASGDQDTYVYDPMESMKSFTFTINGSSKAGALTWNSIGSLRTLAITDTFFSGGAQTCNYVYDDVARITSDTCTGGPAWSQTFAYGPSGTDPGGQYDNLIKSGSSSWNPGYNLTNNQMIGSTYDAAGRLKNDTVNSYTWDQFGMLATATGPAGYGAATYDALGQLVETNDGFAYQQILLSPIGKVAYMSGQTVNYTFVPTPGGGTYLGSGGSNYYFHPDWLGSKPLISDMDARLAFYDVAYTPYGERYNAFGTSGSNLLDFTSHNQDILGGLWHTPNRELSTNASRWISPDPAYASWNAYSYPTDPNTQTDPSGLDIADAANELGQMAQENADDYLHFLAAQAPKPAASCGFFAFCGLWKGLGDEWHSFQTATSIAHEMVIEGLNPWHYQSNIPQIAASHGTPMTFCRECEEFEADILLGATGLEEEEGLEAAFGELSILEMEEPTETFYRTMTQADYKQLVATGKLPSAGQTFISPSLQYAQEYNGVTVGFKVRAGTSGSLLRMGVRNSAGGFAGTVYEGLPNVKNVNGWMSSSAFFKREGGIVNIGLGRGPALNTFNSNIVSFWPIQ